MGEWPSIFRHYREEGQRWYAKIFQIDILKGVDTFSMSRDQVQDDTIKETKTHTANSPTGFCFSFSRCPQLPSLTPMVLHLKTSHQRALHPILSYIREGRDFSFFIHRPDISSATVVIVLCRQSPFFHRSCSSFPSECYFDSYYWIISFGEQVCLTSGKIWLFFAIF